MLSYLNKIHKDAARRSKKSRKPSPPSSPDSFFCGGDDDLSPSAPASSSTPSPNATMADTRTSEESYYSVSKFSTQSDKYKDLPTPPAEQQAVLPVGPGSKPKLAPVKIPATTLKYKKSLSRKSTRSRSKPGSSSSRVPPTRRSHVRSNRRPPTPQTRKSKMTQVPLTNTNMSLNSPESPNSEIPSPVSGATLARNIFSEAFDFTESTYSNSMGNTTYNLTRNDSTTLPRDRYRDRGDVHGRFNQHLSVQTTNISAAEKRWKLYGHWSRPYVGQEQGSNKSLDSPPRYYTLQDLPHSHPDSTATERAAAADLTSEGGMRLTDAFSVLGDDEHTPASSTWDSIWTHPTHSASSVSPPYSVQQSPQKISPEIVHKSVALRRGYHASVQKRKLRTLNVVNEHNDADQESANLRHSDVRHYPVQKTAPLRCSSEVTDFIAEPETGHVAHRHSHSLPNITGQADGDSTVIFDVHIDQDDVVSMASHHAVRDETASHQLNRYRVSGVQRFPETPREVTTFEYPPLPPPPIPHSGVLLKTEKCSSRPSAVEHTDSREIEETPYALSRPSQKSSVSESVTMSRHPSIDRVIHSRSRPPTPNGPRDRVMSRSNSATSRHSATDSHSDATVHDSMNATAGPSVSEGSEYILEAKQLQDLKNILRICITEQTERRTQLLKSIRAAAGDASAVLKLSQELNFVITSYDDLNEDLARADARLLEIKQLQDQVSHKALSTALKDCVTVKTEVQLSGKKDIPGTHLGRRAATEDGLQNDSGSVTNTNQIPDVAPLKVNASSNRGRQTTASPDGLLRIPSETGGGKPTTGLARSPTAGSLLSDVQVILQRDVLNLLGVDELPLRSKNSQSDRSLRPLPPRPTNSAGLFPPDMDPLRSPILGRSRSLPDAPGRMQTW